MFAIIDGCVGKESRRQRYTDCTAADVEASICLYQKEFSIFKRNTLKTYVSSFENKKVKKIRHGTANKNVMTFFKKVFGTVITNGGLVLVSQRFDETPSKTRPYGGYY